MRSAEQLHQRARARRHRPRGPSGLRLGPVVIPIDPETHRHAICRKLPQVLQALREASGLSRAAFARRAGLSPSMVGLVERGRCVPSMDTVARWCTALGVSLVDAFSEAELAQLRV